MNEIDLKNLKVLLINDELFILQIQSMMMNTEKIFDIDLAQNGYEGYNKVILKNYDLVICDINMPVMNGYMFC